MPHRKAVRVLPDPVGARISVWSPAAMAGQPRACASVGSGNDVENHVRTGSLNAERSVMQEGYERTVTGSVGVAARSTVFGFGLQKKNTTAGIRKPQ